MNEEVSSLAVPFSIIYDATQEVESQETYFSEIWVEGFFFDHDGCCVRGSRGGGLYQPFHFFHIVYSIDGTCSWV